MVLPAQATLSTMVDYWDRLEAALKHANKTLKDLQAHLDVTYQALKKVQDGKTKALSAENNAWAARFLGVNSFWLATGEETMLADQKNHRFDTAGLDALTVQENGAAFNVQRAADAVKWPFTTVSYTEFSSLSDMQKGLIEGYTKRLVEEAQPAKSNGTHGGW